MKLKTLTILLCITFVAFISCSGGKTDKGVHILFLHHSTGGVIWNGDMSQFDSDAVRNNRRIKAQLPAMFAQYNDKYSKNYSIEEIIFPKAETYGWNNYPYDYYNIWVKNAGEKYFMKEPTLEILSKNFDVIIFKHCFPVSDIVNDDGPADINSDIKSLQNYKLQYLALLDKMHEFPQNKFILFTGAVQVQSFLTEDEALKTKEFVDWVVSEWDQPNDNVFLWDLYQLQTEGGLYFRDEYAVSSKDSHPNKVFARQASSLLFERIIDIIENDGTKTDLTGKKL